VQKVDRSRLNLKINHHYVELEQLIASYTITMTESVREKHASVARRVASQSIRHEELNESKNLNEMQVLTLVRKSSVFCYLD
jgi:hypothetical protein